MIKYTPIKLTHDLFFFLRWLWTFNVIAWNWTISGKHARWGQGAERIDSAHKYTVCHVFFNLPLILRIQSHFEGKRTNSPIVQIRRTDNPARRRRDRGKKNLLYLFRVPFNQLSYFFTIVNVFFFCYSPFLSISLSLRTVCSSSTTTTTTTTTATRHYI